MQVNIGILQIFVVSVTWQLGNL